MILSYREGDIMLWDKLSALMSFRELRMLQRLWEAFGALPQTPPCKACCPCLAHFHGLSRTSVRPSR